ncbi:MAG: DUF1566 domain-containing protein [Candidatus Omnitrophica bacterium]|nr:DUF1566 domain-containing protein [Candidatus Omnitrophota bacterium]
MIRIISAGLIAGIMLFQAGTGISYLSAQTAADDVFVQSCPPDIRANMTVGLPKTGQQYCYDSSGTAISCSGTGQDAEYADPAGSYDYGYPRDEGSWKNWRASGGRLVANGDGTVTDRSTGLMWVQNASAAGVDGLWQEVVDECANLTHANHSDWRLPNIKEMLSIVDYSVDEGPMDANFFVPPITSFWTSTSYAADTARALIVAPGSGYINVYDKNASWWGWPVRNAD